MIARVMVIALAATAALIVSPSRASGAPVPCANLAKLSLPDTTITSAEEVPAGEWAPPAGPRQPNLPAFCRIALTVPPQIHIEVWLPKDNWNGRFEVKVVEDPRK